MEYRGFLIESFKGHYKVTEIEDEENNWEEDTFQDSKNSIDQEINEREN